MGSAKCKISLQIKYSKDTFVTQCFERKRYIYIVSEKLDRKGYISLNFISLKRNKKFHDIFKFCDVRVKILGQQMF